jgi:hypothetical protein
VAVGQWRATGSSPLQFADVIPKQQGGSFMGHIRHRIAALAVGGIVILVSAGAASGLEVGDPIPPTGGATGGATPVTDVGALIASRLDAFEAAFAGHDLPAPVRVAIQSIMSQLRNQLA